MDEQLTPSPVRRSETIAKLATALAKAQGELRNVTRDQTAKVETRTGGTYQYTYTELSTVIDSVRAVMASNGLAYFQAPGADGQDVTVTTILAHQTGEYLESSLTLRAKDALPQSVGSAITYARRYALLAAVGLAPEDDDGQAAQGDDRPVQGEYRPRTESVQTTPRKGGKITAAQASRIFTIAAKASQDLDELRSYFASRGWPSTKDMPQSAFEDVCERIEAGTIPKPERQKNDITSAKEIGEAVFPGMVKS